ncbi:hypothetical protein [Nocardioides sp. SYSU DS0663]|uniref:hypothetical protein n=1 Tax=Nocardioides sp. SYSU DS0663 TaxID=3416445 RepID=UPI003F4C5445
MRSAPAVVLLLLAGCGSSEVVVVDPHGAPPEPYDGPMTAPVSYADRATPLERSGAAGLALECDGEPWAGGSGSYDDGLAEVSGSVDDVVADWVEDAWPGYVPTEGYRVERVDGDRVLLSLDVDRRTRVAVIAHGEVTDYRHETGWGVESWAQCDVSELPPEVSDQLGIGVWTDEAGDRVPTDAVRSFAGSEHCDWQDATFLRLGSDEGGPEADVAEYLRDPSGELDQLTHGSFEARSTLPEAARDTGWSRDGRRLWLTDDAAYLVSADDPGDVERWPATREPVGCA